MFIRKIDDLYWVTVKLNNKERFTVVNPSRLKAIKLAAKIAFS